MMSGQESTENSLWGSQDPEGGWKSIVLGELLQLRRKISPTVIMFIPLVEHQQGSTTLLMICYVLQSRGNSVWGHTLLTLRTPKKSVEDISIEHPCNMNLPCRLQKLLNATARKKSHNNKQNLKLHSGHQVAIHQSRD